ncbi:alkaline phosphatase [Favolaschia claudopus]|uniref:Altered inheritance of mitochondria protein 6 n=1 Tax=Favolaschia claudopus TaxID=2862362 RepID=A0AAW0EHA2_9AGAR
MLAFLILVASWIGSSSQTPGIMDEIAMLESANSSLLRYPTAFTQNIVPKQIHSHNDYWRDVPLLTALSFGVASVEADVWLVNETLYIGHEMAALTPDRTFDSLYIQPLVSIIDGQNPKSQFTPNQTSINGVFDTASSTPLQLLVDMKTDGPSTLPFVLYALQPLRERGYLTTCESNGTCTQAPVVVVGTGNTPLAGVQALSPRDFFFDAPLTTLNSTFDITLSPIASTDYEVAVGWSGIGSINDTQLAAIKKFVGDAHSLNIRARFWDTPGWPISARNNVWKTLIDNGADWLNADDLEAAATMF